MYGKIYPLHYKNNTQPNSFYGYGWLFVYQEKEHKSDTYQIPLVPISCGAVIGG